MSIDKVEEIKLEISEVIDVPDSISESSEDDKIIDTFKNEYYCFVYLIGKEAGNDVLWLLFSNEKLENIKDHKKKYFPGENDRLIIFRSSVKKDFKERLFTREEVCKTFSDVSNITNIVGNETPKAVILSRKQNMEHNEKNKKAIEKFRNRAL